MTITAIIILTICGFGILAHGMRYRKVNAKTIALGLAILASVVAIVTSIM